MSESSPIRQLNKCDRGLRVMAAISSADCTYLAEGNANVIFTVVAHDKLLRLRKVPRNNEPITSRLTSIDVVNHYERTNRHLFADDQLNHHELVPVATRDIEMLNNTLHSMDVQETRPSNRKGSRLDESEKYGILITPMMKR